MKSATALIALALCQGAWALPRDLAETELFKEYADCAGFHMMRAMVLDQEGREDEAARDVLPTVKQFHKLAEGLSRKRRPTARCSSPSRTRASSCATTRAAWAC